MASQPDPDVRAMSGALTAFGGATADVAANLFMSSAVIHGTPPAAEILGLIKKHPRTASAFLHPDQLGTGQ